MEKKESLPTPVETSKPTKPETRQIHTEQRQTASKVQSALRDRKLDSERLQSLTPIHIVPGKLNPQEAEQYLSEFGNLYDLNLAQDELFRLLDEYEEFFANEMTRYFSAFELRYADHDISKHRQLLLADFKAENPEKVRKIQELLDGGAMLNRWYAKRSESLCYPRGYYSPKLQMEREFSGKPGAPSEFEIMALRAPNGQLVSSLSFRRAKNTVENVRYLRRRLLKVKKENSPLVKFLYDHLGEIVEIDTINVHPDWQGMGTGVRQLLELFEHLNRRQRPEAVFYYRFSGLANTNKFHDLADAFIVGENSSSGKLFNQRCGFRDIGELLPRQPPLNMHNPGEFKRATGDIVAREIEVMRGNNAPLRRVIMAWVLWKYGAGRFGNVLETTRETYKSLCSRK